jgi:hypothetical protein
MFSLALTVVLMLLTVAASAVVLIASFGLIGPVLALLVAALRGITRLPGLAARGCVQAALRASARLPGPRRWHRRVAAHRRSPQSTRMRLVQRRKVTPQVLQAVFVNNTTAEPVRIAVVRRCEEFGGAAQVMPAAVRPWGPAVYAWPLTYTEDAVVVQHALRRCLRFKDRNALRSGYARLARLAGPEAVWAMEYEYVGSLELMDPVVRSSMQAGDSDVLLEWLEEGG